MATCPKCQSSVDGAFCENCGAVLDSPLQPAQGARTGLSENAASALCYLLGFVTGTAFLLLEPYRRSPEVRFHAWQAIFTHLGLILVFAAVGVAQSMLSMLADLDIPGWAVVWFSAVAYWLFVMWKAYQGIRVEWPITGAMARKQAGLGR